MAADSEERSDDVVPIRRTATVTITAAPEPTQWEIIVKSPELGWHFFFGIARSDAPTEERALDLAALYVLQQIQRTNLDARVEL